MTKKTITEGREWLTTGEAAAYSGMGVNAINREINAGRLPAYQRAGMDGRPSKRRTISRADLDAYMRRYPAMSPRDVMHAVGVLAIMAVGMAWPVIEGLAW